MSFEWQFAGEGTYSSDVVALVDASTINKAVESDPEFAVLLRQCERFVRVACRRASKCTNFKVSPESATQWVAGWSANISAIYVCEIAFNAEGHVCKVAALVPPLPGEQHERFIRVTHTGAWVVFRPCPEGRTHRECLTVNAMHPYIRGWSPWMRILSSMPCLNSMATTDIQSAQTWVMDVKAALKLNPLFPPNE